MSSDYLFGWLFASLVYEREREREKERERGGGSCTFVVIAGGLFILFVHN